LQHFRIVAATGNSGLKSIAHPALCHGALAIASVNSQGSLSGFSNHDPNKTYYKAPGGDGPPGQTPTEHVGKDTKTAKPVAGTSMAAAYASGVAALYFEEWDNLRSSGTVPRTFDSYFKSKITSQNLIQFV
jgi:subtilisin family serine protease